MTEQAHQTLERVPFDFLFFRFMTLLADELEFAAEAQGAHHHFPQDAGERQHVHGRRLGQEPDAREVDHK